MPRKWSGGPSEELEGFPGLHSRWSIIRWYIGSLFWGFPVSESWIVADILIVISYDAACVRRLHRSQLDSMPLEIFACHNRDSIRSSPPELLLRVTVLLICWPFCVCVISRIEKVHMKVEIPTDTSLVGGCPFTLDWAHKSHAYRRGSTWCTCSHIDDVGSALNIKKVGARGCVINFTLCILFGYQGIKNGFFPHKICKLVKFCKNKRTKFQNTTE